MQRRKILLALVIVAVLGLAVGGYVIRHGQDRAVGRDARQQAIASGAPDAEAVHVLLLGSDDGRLDGNTDTIMAASINPAERTIYLMSIPRDSRVEIPRHGLDKINAANPMGGPALTVATVENLLGTWIDYYVLMDFKAAARIVDKLGGVTLDVPKRMDKDDPTQNLHIHLRPGRQHLNGQQAINFARFRDDQLGDIGRTHRQQQFLHEMARQLMASATPSRLPSLVPEVIRSVRTNASPADALRLASWFRKDRDWKLVTMTLPGNFLMHRGISYWRVDAQKARTAWAGLMAGHTQPFLDESLAQRASDAAANAGVPGGVADTVYGEDRRAGPNETGAQTPGTQPVNAPGGNVSSDPLDPGGEIPGFYVPGGDAGVTGPGAQSGTGNGTVTDSTYGR